MPCLVGLQKRLLGLCVFEFCISKSRSHVFKPYNSKPRFLYIWALYFQASYFWASLLHFQASFSKPSFHFFKFYFFEPYFFGSLYFFNPNSITTKFLFTYFFIPVILVVKHILKQTNQQTYKHNISTIKLGCKFIEKKQLEPDN